MAKTAVLMPYPELKQEAEAMVARYPRIQPMCVEFVETEQIGRRAEELEKQGCEMIIARGMQARLIRESVVIPVIEMRVSTQELESQVMALAQQIRREDGEPVRIGIIGFFNMIHSMERFNEGVGEALGIDLKVYMATDIEQYRLLVDRAYAERCQGVIGGEVVGHRATELGMAYAFLAMGEESIREVLETATRVAYSIDLMRHNSAEMSIMLDNTFSAIMQVDPTGRVVRANRACYQLLGKQPEQVIRQPLTEVVEGLDEESLVSVLREGKESDLLIVAIQQRSVVINMIPVRVDEQIQGAILTFQEGRQISLMNAQLRQEAARQGYVARFSFKDLATKDMRYHDVLHQAQRLSKHSQAVLLAGESGVGKGLIAKTLHDEGSRWKEPFVTVNCGAIPENLIESELFGYVAGAFTGSRSGGKRGLFEAAQGGTIFLDEISELPLNLQVKLLQVIQERQITPVGGVDPIPVDVRIISATNRDLASLVQEGSFREDLYYRLNVVPIEVPPLRERPDDIVPLLRINLARCNAELKENKSLSAEAISILLKYPWPGNIRELQNIVERLVITTSSDVISDEDIFIFIKDAAEKNTSAAADLSLSYALEKAEREILSQALERYGSTRSIARVLQVSQPTIVRKLRKYGLGK